jgi:hypothetical protein
MMSQMTILSIKVPYKTFSGPEAQSQTERAIYEFTQLPVGWHYGDGGPIGKIVCAMAIDLNRHTLALGLLVTEAFPGINGEVMLSVYHGDNILDFTIFPTGLINFRHEVNDEDVEAVDNLTLTGAKQKLNTFGITTWNLSDSSTPSTLVGNLANSKTSLLRQVRGMGASPSLTASVPWQLANQYVIT